MPRLAPLGFSALLWAALSGGGCAHHVTVRSDPPGARVYVDNVEIGETPVAFDEERGREAPYNLRLEKSGYEPKEAQILPIPSATAGCLLARPWQAALPDELTFQLFPAAGAE